jgi:hypothetical protein
MLIDTALEFSSIQISMKVKQVQNVELSMCQVQLFHNEMLWSTDLWSSAKMASSLLQAAGFSEHDASIHQEHCNIAM